MSAEWFHERVAEALQDAREDKEWQGDRSPSSRCAWWVKQRWLDTEMSDTGVRYRLSPYSSRALRFVREIAEGESTVSGARLGSIAHAVRRLADMTSPDRFAQAQRIDEEIAELGQAAITRPTRVGSATATLAAKLATPPATSSAHGSTPPLRPDRESASNSVQRPQLLLPHRQHRGAQLLEQPDDRGYDLSLTAGRRRDRSAHKISVSPPGHKTGSGTSRRRVHHSPPKANREAWLSQHRRRPVTRTAPLVGLIQGAHQVQQRGLARPGRAPAPPPARPPHRGFTPRRGARAGGEVLVTSSDSTTGRRRGAGTVCCGSHGAGLRRGRPLPGWCR